MGFSVVFTVAVSLAAPLAWSAARPLPSEQYVEGEAIVTFKPSADFAAAQQALGRDSLEFSRHFGFLSQHRRRESGLVRAPGRTTAKLIAEPSAEPEVELAEPNYPRWCFGFTSNDPLSPQLWALQNTGQSVDGTTGMSGADIRFLKAWSLTQTSTAPVVVAVLDTGVDYTHPDLASSMWTNPGETPANSADEDGNGYIDDVYGYDFAGGSGDPFDSGYHGTHVSGTIAATGNNLLGVIGVNCHARLMALKAARALWGFSGCSRRCSHFSPVFPILLEVGAACSKALPGRPPTS